MSKKMVKAIGLLTALVLFALVYLYSGASATGSHEQFMQGSWAFRIAEFPDVETYCQYSSHVIGDSLSGSILCAPGYIPLPTDDGILVLDSKSMGTWTRISDSKFEFRLVRDVLNETYLSLPGLKFIDWGTLTLAGEALTGTVQGAVMDLDGNIIIPLPPLTLTASRIPSNPPTTN